MKTKIIERKVLTEAEWRELLKIVFTITGTVVPDEKIQFGVNDDGGWCIEVGDEICIYHDEQEVTVKDAQGRKRKELTKGYRWMTYHTTYSYMDGYDSIDREHGFSYSPQSLIGDMVLEFYKERVDYALQAFEYDKSVRDEAAFQKQMDVVEHEGEPYDELAGDVRDRLEDHNRQVLSQL